VPKAIIASSNLTTTCRTCATLPCGETLVMRAASARHVKTASRPSMTIAAAHVHFCLRLLLRIGHAPDRLQNAGDSTGRLPLAVHHKIEPVNDSNSRLT
jgi:hypothetical protein